MLFNRLDTALSEARFMTRSGELVVARRAGGNLMSMPSNIVTPYSGDVAAQIGTALDAPPPRELHSGTYLMAVWDQAAIVRAIPGPGSIEPVLESLGFWGLVATAPGDGDYDFVSRFFAPAKAVPEDPVTGSAHCALTPPSGRNGWARRP